MTESDIVFVLFDPQEQSNKQADRARIIFFMFFLYITTSFLSVSVLYP